MGKTRFSLLDLPDAPKLEGKIKESPEMTLGFGPTQIPLRVTFTWSQTLIEQPILQPQRKSNQFFKQGYQQIAKLESTVIGKPSTNDTDLRERLREDLNAAIGTKSIKAYRLLRLAAAAWGMEKGLENQQENWVLNFYPNVHLCPEACFQVGHRWENDIVLPAPQAKTLRSISTPLRRTTSIPLVLEPVTMIHIPKAINAHEKIALLTQIQKERKQNPNIHIFPKTM